MLTSEWSTTPKSYTDCASFVGRMYKKLPLRNSVSAARSRLSDSVKVGMRRCFRASGEIPVVAVFLLRLCCCLFLRSLGFLFQAKVFVFSIWSSVEGDGGGGVASSSTTIVASLDSFSVFPPALRKLFTLVFFLKVIFSSQTCCHQYRLLARKKTCPCEALKICLLRSASTGHTKRSRVVESA